MTQHVHRKADKESAPSSSIPLDLDRQATTQQVDDLLQSTRQMMGTMIPQHLIAFSGGVDSSLTAALVYQSHNGTTERVQAILGVSPAVPAEQVDLAVRVAEQIGVGPLTAGLSSKNGRNHGFEMDDLSTPDDKDRRKLSRRKNCGNGAFGARKVRWLLERRCALAMDLFG